MGSCSSAASSNHPLTQEKLLPYHDETERQYAFSFSSWASGLGIMTLLACCDLTCLLLARMHKHFPASPLLACIKLQFHVGSSDLMM
jgi:hypothetical protein